MKYIILLIFLCFVYCSQPGDGGNENPPMAPSMVEKTENSDFTQLENGIDAVPDGDHIQVMWHVHPQASELKSFIVYKSTHRNGLVNYNPVITFPIENISDIDTAFIDPNVTIGQKNWYFVTAVNQDNIESLPSDTVSYKLLDKADHLITVPNIGSIAFNFQIPTSASPRLFILRIEEEIGSDWNLHHMEVWDDYSGLSISKIVSKDTLMLKDNWLYQWRVDIIEGLETEEGSESSWAPLQVN